MFHQVSATSIHNSPKFWVSQSPCYHPVLAIKLEILGYLKAVWSQNISDSAVQLEGSIMLGKMRWVCLSPFFYWRWPQWWSPYDITIGKHGKPINQSTSMRYYQDVGVTLHGKVNSNDLKHIFIGIYIYVLYSQFDCLLVN